MRKFWSTLLLTLAIPAQVFAISQNDLQAVVNQTTFYDESCVADTGVTLSGNDDLQKAFNFLTGTHHLTDTQAAAILGNLDEESGGFHPTTGEGGQDSTYPQPGIGFGIAQWTDATRQAGLVKLANSENVKPNTLAVQLEYLWDELTGTPPASHEGGLSEVKSAATLQDAVDAFMNSYERPDPSLAHEDVRYKDAVSILHLYGGQDTTDTTLTPDTPGGCSDLTPPGQNTTYVDGFVLYYQFCGDPKYSGSWCNHTYGDGPISSTGCGPTAMAMIISTLTGKHVTPDIAADYAENHGQYVDGAGSKHSIGPVLAAHWNLNATHVGADVQKISAALQSGALVIAEGQGAEPFTGGGHFIVIRAVKDGKWLVGDPGHSDTSFKEWDPNQLVDEMSDDSVYAISK